MRVVGRLQTYNAEYDEALLVDPAAPRKATLVVRTDLLADHDFRLGSLFMVIGELEAGRDADSQLRLRARIASNADGLDMDLYAQSIEVQRRVLSE